ncbi:tetratricopeptide repeat protein [Corallibacter sp.]|uniref:tetratricopeptide repeat-containing sensor histidine kinase n=1 Tax=Corallibacter sp. TaxID=2038084 RepID=UPI003AB1E462
MPFHSTYYSLFIKVFCFFISMSFYQGYSQNNFETLADSIIDIKTSNYQDIDNIFRAFKTDTLKMMYLSKKSKETNYYEGESYALNMIGIVYRNLSLYDKAINAHTEAQQLAKKTENIELETISLNMLGVVYRRMDAIRSALDYHKQALDLAETANPQSLALKRSIAVSQNSMGNIYLALKQYDLAIRLFQKSLTIEVGSDNKLGLAINYHNIGYAQEAKGLLKSALNNYQRSLKYNNDINSEIGRVICYNSIAGIYIKQGRNKKALPLINSALKKALNINDQYYIATSYLNLGLVNLKLNNLKNVEKNLNTALNIAEKYNLKSSKIETYKTLSEYNNEVGNYKEALNYYKKHIELDNTLTNERNLQYVNDLIIKYESEKKNNQIKALANENELVKIRLAQNKRVLILCLVGIALIGAILFILHRQHQLRNEKKIITLEQEMLRNQMNPHFIFNSLNSIKLYIINNEKENAVYYLNKFSKLIRKILIASTEKEISLENELETMTLYMNIENIRFSNKIHYNVIIDENVSLSNIKVPSLILQPFLENALWHGLSSKNGEKKISLQVSKNPNKYVTISITDNGIGRVASQKIKSQSKLQRKSVGLNITKARLDNFSKNLNAQYSIQIEDLYSDNNTPTGTKVIVKIPLKNLASKAS